MKRRNSDLPRPEEYPLGSPESRAAARVWLQKSSEVDEDVPVEQRSCLGVYEETRRLRSGKSELRMGHLLGSDEDRGIVWGPWTPQEQFESCFDKYPAREDRDGRDLPLCPHMPGWPDEPPKDKYPMSRVTL